MAEILLDLESLTERHLDKSEKFKHKTSNQYRLFPFTTKWSYNYYNEFVYFKGILGEVYRNFYEKELPKELKSSENYHLKLKEKLLEEALSKVQIDSSLQKQKLTQFFEDMFFEDGNLFCFAPSTLPYLTFKSNNSTLKQISSFIYEVFLSNPSIQENIDSVKENTNIIYHIIQQSLPELKSKTTASHGYNIWNNEIIESFIEDYMLLIQDEKFFLKHIDLLLKHYYFIYIAQIALSLDDYCEVSQHDIFFLLETEIVSNSRQGFRAGWFTLEKRLNTLFSHANTLELINYIKIDDLPIGNYREIKTIWEQMDDTDKNKLLSCIKRLEEYYISVITDPKTGWQKCYDTLNANSRFQKMACPLEKAIYRFWYIIDYQFLNTGRQARYKDYSLWFTEFCKANFIKRRGRTGNTLKIDQEMLLFLTKLCIGKNSKIRLKSLWTELSKRGVNFDESSKMEVVKLFEKINLIEKKSDSGDAQYVRTIL